MGIGTIVADAQAYLRDNYSEYASTVVAYGRRALTSQNNQGAGRANRVVICPPLGRSGTFGAFSMSPGQQRGAGRDGSGRGRALTNLSFPYEVHCWAQVAAEPTDELANDSAAWLLACATINALRAGHQGGYGAFTLKAGGFVGVPQERRFGSEFVFDYVLDLSVTAQANPAVAPVSFDIDARVVVNPVDDSDDGQDADAQGIFVSG